MGFTRLRCSVVLGKCPRPQEPFPRSSPWWAGSRHAPSSAQEPGTVSLTSVVLSLRVKGGSLASTCLPSLTFLPLSHFTSLTCVGNVQFRHILLRTNDPLLDLILGLSGCLDFLASAFAFVITSLGNVPGPTSRLRSALEPPPPRGCAAGRRQSALSPPSPPPR